VPHDRWRSSIPAGETGAQQVSSNVLPPHDRRDLNETWDYRTEQWETEQSIAFYDWERNSADYLCFCDTSKSWPVASDYPIDNLIYVRAD
jgi:hypothetical protein